MPVGNMINGRLGIPFLPLTFALVAASGVVQCFPQLHPALYFDIDGVLKGQWWRLVSGHFVHSDLQHLLWNSVAFLVLGGMLEKSGAWALPVTLLAGIGFVDLLLVSPFSEVAVYCGMSGFLNSLFVFCLWQHWRTYNNRVFPVIAAAGLLKTFIEIVIQDSLLTEISWPPYPEAHLAGILGGAVLICLAHHISAVSNLHQTSRKRLPARQGLRPETAAGWGAGESGVHDPLARYGNARR